MSQIGLGQVIEQLLTDENLRIQFALDPIETVAELFLEGCDLNRDDVDLLSRTDAGVWFLSGAVRSAPQH
jgi:hypothetical protein